MEAAKGGRCRQEAGCRHTDLAASHSHGAHPLDTCSVVAGAGLHSCPCQCTSDPLGARGREDIGTAARFVLAQAPSPSKVRRAVSCMEFRHPANAVQ